MMHKDESKPELLHFKLLLCKKKDIRVFVYQSVHGYLYFHNLMSVLV